MKSGTKVRPIRGKIRELYLEQGMSQKELVAASGVHRKAVYQAEKGQPILLRHLVRLARALHLPNHATLISGNSGGGAVQDIADNGTHLDHGADEAATLVQGHKTDDDFSHGGLPLPSSQQMATLGRHLTGSWREWHWTKDRNDQPRFIKARWEIDDQGRCSVFHEKSKLNFKGVLHFEGKNRLVFWLAAQEQTQELVCCRCKRPKGEDSDDVEAAWFGLDYDEQLRCDRLLLTRNMEMPEPEAKLKLAGMKHFTVRPEAGADASVRMLDCWSYEEIRKAILQCREGDIIKMISTYYPDDVQIFDWIKELARDNPGPGRPHFRVIFMDFRLTQALKVRKELRSESLEYFQQEIRRQAEALMALNRELRGSVRITVKFSSAWPFGMAFQFGQSAMYIGLIMATQSAALGPMFILTPRHSKAWDRLEADFDAVWRKSTRAGKVLRDWGDDSKPLLTASQVRPLA